MLVESVRAILIGVVLFNVATPPVNVNTKSPTSNAPVPSDALKTGLLKLTLIALLSAAKTSEAKVGAVWSIN